MKGRFVTGTIRVSYFVTKTSSLLHPLSPLGINFLLELHLVSFEVRECHFRLLFGFFRVEIRLLDLPLALKYR